MAPPDDKPENKGRLHKYRETLLEKLVLGLPLGLITSACASLQARLLEAPWIVVALMLPLAGAVWLTWRQLKQPQVQRTLLIASVFLAAYGTIFALASLTDVLVWRRVPNDPGDIQLRAWMLPVRAGDWRYTIAERKAAPADDIVVVLMDRPDGPDAKERLRAREGKLVQLAVAQDARAVGLDVYFEGKSSADSELCSVVERARTANIPVWAGYTKKTLKSGKEVPTATNVLPCFSASNLGSLIGFADSDGRVRAVKLTWARMQDQPAFSVLGARALAASYKQADPLEKNFAQVLRYLPPEKELTVFREVDVIAEPGILHKQLVLIGLNVATDRFHTPFGVLPGTVIQANAIHSLRVMASITRPSGAWNAGLVAVLCYLVVVLAISGTRTRNLILIVAGLSIAVVVASALLMRFWLIWFEVIYALVAMWLLVPLALIARRRLMVAEV